MPDTSDEIRTIDDCWLVQEFEKRYSAEEVKEAIDQLATSLIAAKHDALIKWRDKAIRAEMLKGHWYTGEKQIDARPTYRYSCHCGYVAGSKTIIDSHIIWKLEELRQQVISRYGAEDGDIHE